MMWPSFTDLQSAAFDLCANPPRTKHRPAARVLETLGDWPFVFMYLFIIASLRCRANIHSLRYRELVICLIQVFQKPGGDSCPCLIPKTETRFGAGLTKKWIKGVETAIKTTLRFLRFTKKDSWKEPHFKWFSGGIGEIRSDFGNIEYRPLGCNGPGPDQFTVLIGAYKKGKVWTPADARKSAVRIRKELLKSPSRGNKYAIEL